MKRPLLLAALTCAACLASRPAVCQVLEGKFLVFADGQTRTYSSGITAWSLWLRDNPSPPPNPTTVTLENYSAYPYDRLDPRPAVILDGSSILNVQTASITAPFAKAVLLHDHSRLNVFSYRIVAEGRSSAIHAEDDSTVDIAGGAIMSRGESLSPFEPLIVMEDHTTLRVHGAPLPDLPATLNGMGSQTILALRDNTKTTIQGKGTGTNFGSAGVLIAAQDSAVVDVLGGRFFFGSQAFTAEGQAAINIRGGLFRYTGIPMLTPNRGLEATDLAAINIFGTSFLLNGVPIQPGLIPEPGRLSATLADGTPLTIPVRGNVYVHQIPEPSAFALAAIGLIALSAIRGRLRRDEGEWHADTVGRRGRGAYRGCNMCRILLPMLLFPQVAKAGPFSEVPLKKIWAYRMTGTRDVRELEPDVVRALKMRGRPITSEILRALRERDNRFVDRPAPPLGNPQVEVEPLERDPVPVGRGFPVTGTGRVALGKARPVLTGKKERVSALPPGDVTLVFYSLPAGMYVQLYSVKRYLNDITINYRFVTHGEMEMTTHFALIPLGKLAAGEYRVAVVQLAPAPSIGDDPPRIDDFDFAKAGRERVCGSFTFKVR